MPDDPRLAVTDDPTQSLADRVQQLENDLDWVKTRLKWSDASLTEIRKMIEERSAHELHR